MKKPYLRVLAVAAVLSLVAVACSNKTAAPSASTGASTGAVHHGGTYRTEIEAISATDGYDPVGEYYATAFGLFTDMLLRTLVNTNHVANAPGNTLYPDLASSMPQVSNDGLTYTFHLKSGIKYAPPVNREITSKDIEYAFERLDNSALLAEYGFYFDGVIQGMNGPVAHPKPISGISTPNAKTIIFHLVKPTGDFLYRLSMPATAPVPPEVGHCFDTKAALYGRDLIASGPYMYKGADKIKVSPCSAIKPMAGIDLTKGLVLVRNPNYSPSTDTKAMRENNIDGFQVTVNTNTADIFNKISSGALDGSWASVPPATVINQYQTNPSLKPNFHTNAGDRTWYVFMNMTVPPFDDIHVRKALSYALNKSALIKACGGVAACGPPSGHIYPPTVLPAEPVSFDPYASPGSAGDIAKAQAEMKLSKYDPKHDGKCDVASVCQNILFIDRNYAPWTSYDPIVEASFAPLGITLKPRDLDPTAMSALENVVKNQVPISIGQGWGKDYADPFTFANPLFDSKAIVCGANNNYALTGITASIASKCGIKLPASGPPPSVDNLINKCEPLSGSARDQCWVSWDKFTMENVVPWIPWRWGVGVTIVAPTVTKWEFDQFAGYISFCHISVNNNIDPNTLSV